MTTIGWAFLVISWGSILSLATFCFARTLKKKT
jgi:hypothetical protein